MRLEYLGILSIAALALTGHGAAAEGSWYISGSAGAVVPWDYSRSVTVTNPSLELKGPGTNTTTYSPGASVDLGIGYRLPNGFRIEGELGYQRFLTDTVAPLSTNGLFPAQNGTRLSNPSGGAHDIFTSTANLFYDLPFTFAGITPYVGGGAGYFHANVSDAVFAVPLGGRFDSRGGTGGNAIVLGEAGASYALSSNLSLTAAYRYEHFFQSVAPNGSVFKLGVRYTFGAAPVQAVAAPTITPSPAIVPARSYLVFFDWDKANLTDRARQIVAEAAAASTQVKYSRIEVSGYTDTSGTPRHNQELSLRRAQAVAAELVKQDVPAAAISIQGFGETHLLVPTGNGVREPQNRRVEIVIR